MIATTLTTIPDTQVIEIILCVKFDVAINKIKNANSIAMNIPDIAPFTNAISLGIKSQP
jgi:hypothetical protein